MIRESDFVQSVADALQFISYYHPLDFIAHGHERICTSSRRPRRTRSRRSSSNSRMCAEGHRPICQDTGIVTVFMKVGMNVRFDSERSLQEIVDDGVRRALSASRQRAARVDRCRSRSSRGKTPRTTHRRCCTSNSSPGNTVDVQVAAKGGGSENKSKIAVLNPSDSIVDWVVKTVPTMGAGWCPPGMLGIGIGGTAEKACVLAKESLMDPIDIHELLKRAVRRIAPKNCGSRSTTP